MRRASVREYEKNVQIVGADQNGATVDEWERSRLSGEATGGRGGLQLYGASRAAGQCKRRRVVSNAIESMK